MTEVLVSVGKWVLAGRSEKTSPCSCRRGLRKEPGVSGELLPLGRLGAARLGLGRCGSAGLRLEEALKGEERESRGPATPLCVFLSFPHHV